MIVRSDVPNDGTPPGGDGLRDDAGVVRFDVAFSRCAKIEAEIARLGLSRIVVRDVERRADPRRQPVRLAPLDEAADRSAEPAWLAAMFKRGDARRGKVEDADPVVRIGRFHVLDPQIAQGLAGSVPGIPLRLAPEFGRRLSRVPAE